MNFFTGEEPPHHLNNTHVFDCPIDILEKNLVNDKGIPNAPIVVFTLVILNIIPVMLFLFDPNWNPKTKLVSPQYHIVFDKESTMVSADRLINAEDVNLALAFFVQVNDQFAETTKEDNTQHYDFDSDWLEQEMSEMF